VDTALFESFLYTRRMHDFSIPNPFIPDLQHAVSESEMEIDFIRSSGPGGQNVNKTSSKAQLRWNISASKCFSDRDKARLREYFASRITKEGDIVLFADSERSQAQNKEAVIRRLQSLVRAALKAKKKRIATKPTRGSKERRLQEKKQQSQKKQARKPLIDE